MRGWVDRIPGFGLLLDVASGRTVLTSLASPHDARRWRTAGW